MPDAVSVFAAMTASRSVHAPSSDRTSDVLFTTMGPVAFAGELPAIVRNVPTSDKPQNVVANRANARREDPISRPSIRGSQPAYCLVPAYDVASLTAARSS